MCDINKKTRLKSVAVYKVCIKIDNKYYAYFSGMEVKVGKVKNLPFYTNENGSYGIFKNRYVYKTLTGGSAYSPNYNENLIGKTSGFKLMKVAKILFTRVNILKPNSIVIVKLLIAGDIMQGTGEGILRGSQNISSSTVYAGTQILAVKEIMIK